MIIIIKFIIIITVIFITLIITYIIIIKINNSLDKEQGKISWIK